MFSAYNAINLCIEYSAISKLLFVVVYFYSPYYADPSKVTCFGGPFGQFLTEYFLGYDMMVISSFKSLLPSNRGKELFAAW